MDKQCYRLTSRHNTFGYVLTIKHKKKVEMIFCQILIRNNNNKKTDTKLSTGSEKN